MGGFANELPGKYKQSETCNKSQSYSSFVAVDEHGSYLD